MDTLTSTSRGAVRPDPIAWLTTAATNREWWPSPVLVRVGVGVGVGVGIAVDVAVVVVEREGAHRARREDYQRNTSSLSGRKLEKTRRCSIRSPRVREAAIG